MHVLRALSLCLLLSLLGAPEGIAQKWPERPVKLVVPYPAGGGTDTVARVMAQKLGDKLAQRFVVENRARGERKCWSAGGREGGTRRVYAARRFARGGGAQPEPLQGPPL